MRIVSLPHHLPQQTTPPHARETVTLTRSTFVREGAYEPEFTQALLKSLAAFALSTPPSFELVAGVETEAQDPGTLLENAAPRKHDEDSIKLAGDSISFWLCNTEENRIFYEVGCVPLKDAQSTYCRKKHERELDLFDELHDLFREKIQAANEKALAYLEEQLAKRKSSAPGELSRYYEILEAFSLIL